MKAFRAIRQGVRDTIDSIAAGTFGNDFKGSPLEFGRALFTVYLLPFEVTSVLILIAILGAVVLAKKEID